MEIVTEFNGKKVKNHAHNEMLLSSGRIEPNHVHTKTHVFALKEIRQLDDDYVHIFDKETLEWNGSFVTLF